jgi:hypothetical protein
MDYDSLLFDAVQKVLADYEKSRIEISSEADFQSHLFHECRVLLEKAESPHPLKIFAEKGCFGKHSKVAKPKRETAILKYKVRLF